MTKLYPHFKHALNTLSLFEQIARTLKNKGLILFVSLFCLAGIAPQKSMGQCPTVQFNTGGGGAYCAGGPGVTITLDGSEAGIDYWLIDGSSTDVTFLPGTGADIPHTAEDREARGVGH